MWPGRLAALSCTHEVFTRCVIRSHQQWIRWSISLAGATTSLLPTASQRGSRHVMTGAVRAERPAAMLARLWRPNYWHLSVPRHRMFENCTSVLLVYWTALPSLA